MNHREIIFDMLRRIGRRLWVRQALREVAFGTCVVLFLLVALQLVRHALGPVSLLTGLDPLVFAAPFLIVLVVYFGWRLTRRVSLARAAGEADVRGGLKDELKSAYWFISRADASPFAQMQVGRAAATAERLDPAKIVPGKPPRSLFAALALGLLLVLTTSLDPQLSHSWQVHETVLGATDEAPDPRALLQDLTDNAQVERLDRALAALQDEEVSREEKLLAAAAARDAIEQVNIEAVAARETLAQLAEALKANPELAEVAKALREGRSEEALGLLKEMQTAARDQTGAPGSDDGEQGRRKTGEAASGAEQALQKAARELGGVTARLNEDAMAQVMSAIESADDQIEAQTRVNQIRRRTDQSAAATEQRSTLTASQFSSPPTNALNPTPSPDSGNADILGGTLYRQGAVVRSEDDDGPSDHSRVGSSSGDAEALPLEGTATQRLDAQLKLETLQRRDQGEDSGDDKEQEWFYSASPEQKSKLGFVELRDGQNFDREDATRFESIPVRQKQIVKDYFLNLHESEKK